jgi:hypothetical protein
MLEDDAGVLRFAAASDDTVRHIESLQIGLDEGPSVTAYDTGEQVLLADASDGSGFRRYCAF